MALDEKGSAKFLAFIQKETSVSVPHGKEPQMLGNCSPLSSGVIIWEPLLSVQSSVTVHPIDDDIFHWIGEK